MKMVTKNKSKHLSSMTNYRKVNLGFMKKIIKKIPSRVLFFKRVEN